MKGSTLSKENRTIVVADGMLSRPAMHNAYVTDWRLFCPESMSSSIFTMNINFMRLGEDSHITMAFMDCAMMVAFL